MLANAAFEAHAEQLLRLDGKLHGELPEDFLAEAVDDHADGIFQRDAALLAVEKLVFADLDVDASCSARLVVFWTSMYGVVCAPHLSPSSSESHWV